MNKSIDPARLHQARTRRETLGLLGASAVMLGMNIAPGSALGQSDDEKVLTEALVLRDPDIPATGNLDGDITIVEYFDYQCPYCRKIEPELRQVVQDDGKVRLVMKDWPLVPASISTASRATSQQMPRRSTRYSRATATRQPRSASRARRPSSSANFGCRAS